tara:strand:+ start:279 stop:485 length:207 start_codon:yes stop_codon:yes gene_type:complete
VVQVVVPHTMERLELEQLIKVLQVESVQVRVNMEQLVVVVRVKWVKMEQQQTVAMAEMGLVQASLVVQ